MNKKTLHVGISVKAGRFRTIPATTALTLAQCKFYRAEWINELYFYALETKLILLKFPQISVIFADLSRRSQGAISVDLSRLSRDGRHW